jgi:hypothetical protein
MQLPPWHIEMPLAGPSTPSMADNGSLLDRITRRFPFLERIFADGGCQGPRVAAAAPRPVEIIKRTDPGFVVQPKRWVIERTFAWACINRRLARDVERDVETVKALFQIAMIELMSWRIARYRDF